VSSHTFSLRFDTPDRQAPCCVDRPDASIRPAGAERSRPRAIRPAKQPGTCKAPSVITFCKVPRSRIRAESPGAHGAEGPMAAHHSRRAGDPGHECRFWHCGKRYCRVSSAPCPSAGRAVSLQRFSAPCGSLFRQRAPAGQETADSSPRPRHERKLARGSSILSVCSHIPCVSWQGTQGTA
jgi:hypothetical protein